MTTDHDRVKRWLLGLAERQVTASGSRATFTSDMYFEAAESIEQLSAEIAKLKAELEEAREAVKPFAAIPPVVISEVTDEPLWAAHYWCVVGHPDKSHFTRDDLKRAIAFLKKAGK